MAIENFLKPDLLEGDNQYACVTCDKKVDALKGLKLSKCPKIISLSLNRFTLDYDTFQRVKVTERVSFPLILNLNDYMKGYEGITNKLYEQEVERMHKYQQKDMIKNKEAEQNKKKVLEERKKKIEIDTNPKNKLDSDEEPSPKAAPARIEKAVKIQVGENT